MRVQSLQVERDQIPTAVVKILETSAILVEHGRDIGQPPR